MTTNHSITWKVSLVNADLGCAIVARLAEVTREHLPSFLEMLPFGQSWICDVHSWDGWIVATLKEKGGTNVPPSGGNLTDSELISSAQAIVTKTRFPSFDMLVRELPSHAFSFSSLTYVGPFENGCLSWSHINGIVVNWMAQNVFPEIEKRNRDRVLRVIPRAPSYDMTRVLRNIYVLESEDSSLQGTCFHLEGIGLVTCQHIIRPDLVAFHPTSITQKSPVSVISQNSTLDLAIIEAPKLSLENGLPRGTADNLNLMAHVAIAGFPNYRFGDMGILSPGLVIGFRTVSSIRRILVNIPIIAGNSGGPAIDADGQVIGVAVTGADRLENATSTENHGIVPLDALSFLLNTS